ncbi:MAG: DUF2330 domain-containing protein [Bacteroidia bacterium]|nr:DUF2330 domain-containing protein [Bacteroidia bacterium]
MNIRQLTLILLLLALSPVMQSFCGFYVAKADARLWNKASSVILTRQGEQTAVTMISDFQGDVKDFAIVIPVPVVLKKEQIRIADASVFQTLDDYSAPRLVEYHDENPCDAPRYELMEDMVMSAPMEDSEMKRSAPSGPRKQVTILERYTVGEYDILILSAEESSGLKTWLNDNGYRVPADAEEVLDPYLKSGMKFFVAKVNLENYAKSGSKELRPIQMTFQSPKFMLPIRLGMANANGDQDLIIYAITDQGRVETANYRTLDIPSDKQVPLFVKEKFGAFYRDLFQKAWKNSGENTVWTEYAWDLSSSNYSHCDPCTGTPPQYADLREAGVFWVTAARPNGYSISDYTGNLFFTRLHVRYRRSTFPQDLVFIATPNKTQHQGRYILTHPATGDLTCPEGKNYKKSLLNRRQDELRNLSDLTGWANATDYLYSTPLEGERQRMSPYLEPIRKRDTLDKGSLPILQTPDQPTPPAPTPELPPARRQPWSYWFVALAGLGAALGGWLWMRHRTTPASLS